MNIGKRAIKIIKKIKEKTGTFAKQIGQLKTGKSKSRGQSLKYILARNPFLRDLPVLDIGISLHDYGYG